MKTFLTPTTRRRHSGGLEAGAHGLVELGDLVDAPFPRVRRLFENDAGTLFGEGPDNRRVVLGIELAGLHVGTEVEIEVLGCESARRPVPSSRLGFSCTPVDASHLVEGMTAEVEAYPISRRVTGITLEGVYRAAPERGRLADRLIVHRAVRACATDLFESIVHRIEHLARSGRSVVAGRQGPLHPFPEHG